RVTVHAGDRAEGAGERAAARGRHRDDAPWLPPGDERVVGDRIDVEIRDLGALRVAHDATVLPVAQVLDLLEALAALDRVDQLHEGKLALAADDEVRMGEP